MKRLTYMSGRKPPRACIDPGDTWNDDWTYEIGEKQSIEVHDALEGEEWEDTGLLDERGEPIYRITHYVRRPMGFVVNPNE